MSIFFPFFDMSGVYVDAIDNCVNHVANPEIFERIVARRYRVAD